MKQLKKGGREGSFCKFHQAGGAPTRTSVCSDSATAGAQKTINVCSSGQRRWLLSVESVATAWDLKKMIEAAAHVPSGTLFFLKHGGRCLADSDAPPSHCGPDNPIEVELRVRGGAGGAGQGEEAGAAAGATGDASAPATDPAINDDSYMKMAALRGLVLRDVAPARLLKASFLLTVSRTRVPRRQELEQTQEEDAFASKDMLERALGEVEKTAKQSMSFCMYPGIVVLSYCWASTEHPDPDGEQFAMLQEMLRWYMANRAAARKEYADFCVFIDFHSLYQGADRTEEQERLFTEGLHRMDVLYGHRGTMVWVLSKPPPAVAADPTRGSYDDRGWTTFEKCVASLAKSASHVLDMGNFELEATGAGRKLMEGSPEAFLAMPRAQLRALADPDPRFEAGLHWPGEGFLGTLTRGREAPLHPTMFGEVVKRKNFSNESDREIVGGLFSKVATAVLGSVEDANFSGVEWTQEQLGAMGGAMPLCTKARELRLFDCRISSEGLAAFANALTPNAAPALERLDLDRNALEGEAGLAALGGALTRGALPRLGELNLSRCGISSEGLAAFANALTPNAAPALETLLLDRNALEGEAGLAALGGALTRGALPRLRDLRLGRCRISSEGLAAFANALTPNAAPALETLWLNALEGNAGWEALGEALRRGALPALRKVDGVSEEGQALLRAAAPEREWKLDLGQCSISSEGLAAFANALTPNAAPALVELHLEKNALKGNAGWEALGEALRRGALPALCKVVGVSEEGQAFLRAAAPEREWRWS